MRVIETCCTQNRNQEEKKQEITTNDKPVNSDTKEKSADLGSVVSKGTLASKVSFFSCK